MTTELKLTKVDGQNVLSLPREVLERLHLSAGESVRVAELNSDAAKPAGDADEMMRVAEDVMRRRHSMLRRLAE